MTKFLIGFGTALAVGGAFLASLFLMERFEAQNPAVFLSKSLNQEIRKPPQKSKEELVAEALEKSSRVKALYMTADVANGKDAGAVKIRRKIIELAEKTEINGIVVDVKEVCGSDYDEESLKKLLSELKQKNIWAIARIAVFKDASQIYAHPEWYLKRSYPKPSGDECFRKRGLRVPAKGGKMPETVFWRDRKGGYWFDPASDGVGSYILEISKKMIDLGFGELQFDYIRFPSDGDVENAVYPVWNGKTPKHFIMKSFFDFLNKNLKAYKPEIILSADLFGYAAIHAGDVSIGQRLEDVGDNFDYLSFMIYPSHYYSGFYLPEDPVRKLPAVNYTPHEVRDRPDVVVGRSLLFARDFLDGVTGTSSYGYSPDAAAVLPAAEPVGQIKTPAPRSKARLRPWLEDFFHEEDKAAGRPWGADKMRFQIEAAEKAENHGWMLWSAANVYTENALREE